MIAQGNNFRLVTGAEAQVSLAAHFAQLRLRPRDPLEPTSYHQIPPAKYDRWTKEEDIALRLLAPTTDIKELSSYFERSGAGVRARCYKLGLVPAKAKRGHP